MVTTEIPVALGHQDNLAGAEPAYRQGGEGGGINGAPDGLPQERGHGSGRNRPASPSTSSATQAAHWHIGELLRRLRDSFGHNRTSLPRRSEDPRLLIVAAGAAILVGYLVSVLTYPGGGDVTGKLASATTRASPSASPPSPPAQKPQPKRPDTVSATATSRARQPPPSNVVRVPRRNTPENFTGVAPRKTTGGSIQSVRRDSSQAGRTRSGSSAPASSNIGSGGSAGATGSGGGIQTGAGGTNATAPPSTRTITSGSATVSGSDTTAGGTATPSGTGTASGGG